VTAETDTVQIAHEALIRAWPQLRLWIQSDRATLLIHQQLSDDAAEWDRHGHDPAFLYRGTRLAAARDASARWEADPARYPALTDTPAVSSRPATRPRPASGAGAACL
jgi:hypothetical protein